MPSVDIGTTPLLRALLLFAALSACSEDDPRDSGDGGGSPAPEVPTPPITPLPLDVTVNQRSSIDIPASGGDVRLTIGDVTGGQVTCGMAGRDGNEILPNASMKPGEERAFHLHGTPLAARGGSAFGSKRVHRGRDQGANPQANRGFVEEFATKRSAARGRFGRNDFHHGLLVLRLSSLRNKLIGMDSATFSIHATSPVASTMDATASTVTEQIEALLGAIAGLEDAVFLRNGSEYTAQEAAEHLRNKWSTQESRITTASQFIDRLASKSSISGEAYQIRFKDGHEVTARAFLEERLTEIQARRSP